MPGKPKHPWAGRGAGGPTAWGGATQGGQDPAEGFASSRPSRAGGSWEGVTDLGNPPETNSMLSVGQSTAHLAAPSSAWGEELASQTNGRGEQTKPQATRLAKQPDPPPAVGNQPKAWAKQPSLQGARPHPPPAGHAARPNGQPVVWGNQTRPQPAAWKGQPSPNSARVETKSTSQPQGLSQKPPPKSNAWGGQHTPQAILAGSQSNSNNGSGQASPVTSQTAGLLEAEDGHSASKSSIGKGSSLKSEMTVPSAAANRGQIVVSYGEEKDPSEPEAFQAVGRRKGKGRGKGSTLHNNSSDSGSKAAKNLGSSSAGVGASKGTASDTSDSVVGDEEVAVASAINTASWVKTGTFNSIQVERAVLSRGGAAVATPWSKLPDSTAVGSHTSNATVSGNASSEEKKRPEKRGWGSFVPKKGRSLAAASKQGRSQSLKNGGSGKELGTVEDADTWGGGAASNGGKTWSVAGSENRGASSAHDSRTLLFKNERPKDESDDDSASDEGSDDEHLRYEKLYARFCKCAEDWSMDDITDGFVHCPVCRGKPGAGTLYRGLHHLIQHAKDYKKHRFDAHKEFAAVMRTWMEKYQVSSGGLFGSAPRERWVGPDDEEVEEVESRDIVWPPMVLVRNTDLYLDDDKWVGMGNQELRDKFKKFNMVNSEHADGPQGHRGMSMLVFERTPAGWMEADALARKFAQNGTGRSEWERLPRRKVFRDPEAKHILYGYLADAGDVEYFNQHRKEKDKLKFSLRKYGDAVVRPMRKAEEERAELQKSHLRALAAIEEKEVLSKENKERMAKILLRDKQLTIHVKLIDDLQTKHKEEIKSLEEFYKEEVDEISEKWSKDKDTVTKKKEADVLQAKQRILDVCDSAKNSWVPGMEFSEEQTLPVKLQSELSRVMHHQGVTQDELLEYEEKLKALLEQQHSTKKEFLARKHREELELEKEMDDQRRALLEALAVEGEKPGFAKGVDVWSSTDFGN